jgi:hypothetical protein
MKTISSALLLVATVNAGVIRERTPQLSFAPDGTVKLGNGLGPMGLDLSFLQGFDGARLGPFFASIQPYFRSVAKNGTIPKVLSVFVPTLPLASRKEEKPQVRQTAKRQISRLGPLTLTAKGVRYHQLYH